MKQTLNEIFMMAYPSIISTVYSILHLIHSYNQYKLLSTPEFSHRRSNTPIILSLKGFAAQT